MDTSTQPIPNPGSQEAFEQDCCCPIIDNYYGKGRLINGRREFWISEFCPLHGKPPKDKRPRLPVDADGEVL